MKATEFADYFDFTIMLASENNNDPDEYNGEKYAVVDKEMCFSDRYINNVSELADCFDSMLMDYVDSVLDHIGFEFDSEGYFYYYEQAQKWLETNCPDHWILGIVRALADCGESIEDDVMQKGRSVMTAEELYNYLKERNATDLPILFDNGERFEYVTDTGISIYNDCVQID